MARKLPIPNGRLDGALDANGMRIVNLMEPMSGDDAATKKYVDEHSGGGGGGGTGNYNDLSHKPKIGGHVLDEETTLDQIGAQKKLTPGTNVEITEDGVVNVTGGNVVESESNPGWAANSDFAFNSVYAESAFKDDKGNNIADTYARKDELRVAMFLDGGEGAYEVTLNDRTLTFAEIKTYAETRNAVIIHGRGTYRPTYVSESEMMWDCTGTVAGKVQTGMIHIFAAGNVVQLVPAKELAPQTSVDNVSDKVDAISASVSTDNRFLVNGTTAAIQTRENEDAEWASEIKVDKGYDAVQGSTMVKLDKSVQTVTVAGGTLTVELPDAVDGTVRDLCLYVNNTSPTETVTLNFPTGVTAYKTKGGDDPKAAAQAGGLTAYYFTEIPGGAWRVMRNELEVVA